MTCVPNEDKSACVSAQSDQSTLFTRRNFASLDIQNAASEENVPSDMCT